MSHTCIENLVQEKLNITKAVGDLTVEQFKHHKIQSVNQRDLNIVAPKEITKRDRSSSITSSSALRSDWYNSTKVVKNIQIDSVQKLFNSTYNSFNIDGIKENSIS